jgi:uncharacterized membrane protein YfcA
MALLFFIIAAAYSTVGFGGGSSYIAALVLFGLPYQDIPSISLLCNLVVVSSGAYHFIKNGHFSWPLARTFLTTSIPMAFLGGLIPITQQAFTLTLGILLILAGIRLLWTREEPSQAILKIPFSNSLAIFFGSLLGFLSGLVGIGGGIFLSPLLMGLGWGKPKQIAATASIFILLNSFAGLVGQTIKHRANLDILLQYWPLFIAVFLGGQIGSRIGSNWLSQLWIVRLTSILVLWVGLRLVF